MKNTLRDEKKMSKSKKRKTLEEKTGFVFIAGTISLTLFTPDIHTLYSYLKTAIRKHAH